MNGRTTMTMRRQAALRLASALVLFAATLAACTTQRTSHSYQSSVTPTTDPGAAATPAEAVEVGEATGAVPGVGTPAASGTSPAVGTPPAIARQRSGRLMRDQQRSLQTPDGRTRTYLLHLPPVLSRRRPAALLLALHGSSGNGQDTQETTGLNALADQAGFIVVYPDGTGRNPPAYTWDAYACCGYALQQKVDDVGFMRAIVAALRADYAIDPNRIDVTGFSNGAMMAYRLACEASDLFVAVASVSGAMDTLKCAPQRPVSVLEIHGTDDGAVPYQGGRPGEQSRRVDRPVVDTIGYWVDTDGCAPEPDSRTEQDLTFDLYAPCRENTAVELITIEGGGHVWPGGPLAAGTTSEELPASQTIWEFFAAHPRV